MLIILFFVTQTKTPLNENESSKWHKKTKNTASRRIFDDFSASKEQASQLKSQANSNSRKRHGLSLGLNTTRLKQSTLNFPRVSLSTVHFKFQILIFFNHHINFYVYTSSMKMKRIAREFRAKLLMFSQGWMKIYQWKRPISSRTMTICNVPHQNMSQQ